MKKKKLKIKREKKIETLPELNGLNQLFKTQDGKKLKLKDILKKDDWWELKNRNKIIMILTHDAVKKIADEAGISTNIDYSILTQPSHENNYQQTWQAKISDPGGKITVEIGEVNRNNLGSRGRNNPANMAQKRAYDRAVLRHLGIVGFLGEDELPEKEEEKMENLTPDDAKQIVALLNQIFAAKDKKELMDFSNKMQELKLSYSELQLEVLRNAWGNQMVKFNKSF